MYYAFCPTNLAKTPTYLLIFEGVTHGTRSFRIPASFLSRLSSWERSMRNETLTSSCRANCTNIDSCGVYFRLCTGDSRACGVWNDDLKSQSPISFLAKSKCDLFDRISQCQSSIAAWLRYFLWHCCWWVAKRSLYVAEREHLVSV